MSIQLIQTQATRGNAKTATELDLGIKLIDDVVLRMPYAAVGLAVNPIHTSVVRMPYAAVGLAANPVHGTVVRMPYAAGRSDLRATREILATV